MLLSRIFFRRWLQAFIYASQPLAAPTRRCTSFTRLSTVDRKWFSRLTISSCCLASFLRSSSFLLRLTPRAGLHSRSISSWFPCAPWLMRAQASAWRTGASIISFCR